MKIPALPKVYSGKKSYAPDPKPAKKKKEKK